MRVPIAFAGFFAAVLASGCSPRATRATPAVAAAARPAAPSPRAPYTVRELAATVGLEEIALSPDGRRVAFVSDESGAHEVWLATLDGHALSAPAQATRLNERVSGLVWSPDSSTLLFAADHGGDEREDLWLLPRDGGTPTRLTETKPSEEDVHFSPDGASIAYAIDREREGRFDLEVMDLSSKKTRTLTHGRNNVSAIHWSRDGKRIACLVSPDDQKGVLLVVNVASGAAREIAPPTKEGLLAPAGFLPDGRIVATATNEAGFRQLALVDPQAASVRFAGPAEWDVEIARVETSGAVIVARNVRGESEVSLAPGPDPFAASAPPSASAPAFRVLARGGAITDLSVDEAGSRIVAIRDSSSRPAEIVEIAPAPETADVSPRTLLPAAIPGVDLSSLAAGERRTVKSFDGTPIDFWIWKPPVARLGTPAPLIVWVHGGPDSQTRGSFSSAIQAFTEAGIAVVQPNYRGSSGYGKAFEDKNNLDWGGGDLKDLLAVVDDLGARREIDPLRVGIFGGSYGGYMVLRALTAAPDRFAAGVDLYGMPDLVADYRLTEGRFGTWYETEMGTPEKNPDLFRERSPVNALEKIRAPLLVLQGANDTSVPKAESDLVVEALRKRGVTVEYVVYPNEGHGFTHRENRLDAGTRAVGFFTRHLAPRTGAPAKPHG